MITIVHALSIEAISFQGVNLADGDRAKWVRADATDCSSTNDATGWTYVTSGSARFTFGSRAGTGPLVLCYKFRFGGVIPASPYLLFPNIRVAVMRFDSVAPHAAGVACPTTVTVSGASESGGSGAGGAGSGSTGGAGARDGSSIRSERSECAAETTDSSSSDEC